MLGIIRAMRFLAVIILLGSLAASLGSDDTTTRQIVGTWQHDSRFSPSMTILADGSFVSSFVSTNHTVVLTYQGTWQIKDRELIMTITNVGGSIPHEPVGSIDRLRIIELDSHHMTFTYQAAPNCVATNTCIRRP
jgi:hypothetical protein